MIIDFLSKETGVEKNLIRDTTSLLGDLKIDGDDAWVVISFCHEEMKVDFTNFDFSEHFRNEPCSKGLFYLYRKIKYKDEHLAANKTPITVGQLVSACDRGYW